MGKMVTTSLQPVRLQKTQGSKLHFILYLLDSFYLKNIKHPQYEILTLGRKSDNLHLDSFINLFAYEHTSIVSREHLHIDLNENTLWLSTRAKNSTFYINKELKAGKKYKLINNSLLVIGGIEIIIKFVKDIKSERYFQLILQNSSKENILNDMSQERFFPNKRNEQDIRSEELIEIKGVKYPRWVIEDAEWVVEQMGGDLISAIESVLEVYEAEINATSSDENEPIKALFNMSKRL